MNESLYLSGGISCPYPHDYVNETEETCQLHDCPFHWNYDDWKECHCDTERQYRDNAKCIDTRQNPHEQVENNYCVDEKIYSRFCSCSNCIIIFLSVLLDF